VASGDRLTKSGDSPHPSVESRLAGMRAVTDVVLAYLDLDDLLNEVLVTVRADTAAVDCALNCPGSAARFGAPRDGRAMERNFGSSGGPSSVDEKTC
jgi:hypothetical protein